jgi:hypothetical protein
MSHSRAYGIPGPGHDDEMPDYNPRGAIWVDANAEDSKYDQQTDVGPNLLGWRHRHCAKGTFPPGPWVQELAPR